MERVFLLLGSNQGNKAEYLHEARKRLAASAGEQVALSSIYRTAAWGKTDQPDFYNQVIELTTRLSPHALLEEILSIEISMGRKRLERWGERIIDIDILLFGSRIINEHGLTLPHPQLPMRRFALAPLAELAGDVIHPVANITINSLLTACSDALEVEKLGAGDKSA
jgi:2-amino-4-hydroxy-6-hydroxymethyldihydropteridine diphosphokinase